MKSIAIKLAQIVIADAALEACRRNCESDKFGSDNTTESVGGEKVRLAKKILMMADQDTKAGEAAYKRHVDSGRHIDMPTARSIVDSGEQP